MCGRDGLMSPEILVMSENWVPNLWHGDFSNDLTLLTLLRSKGDGTGSSQILSFALFIFLDI